MAAMGKGCFDDIDAGVDPPPSCCPSPPSNSICIYLHLRQGTYEKICVLHKGFISARMKHSSSVSANPQHSRIIIFLTQRQS
ncbi:unnamed protein product [Musa acuminata var. zebrina]